MSISTKKCCVPGCADSGHSHSTLHLFPKPADTKRFNAWVLAIRGDIIGLDNKTIYKHCRVCHSHFEEKYCCRYNRLSNIAVPTLNLPGPLSLPIFTHSERRPLRNIDNISRTTPSTSTGYTGLSSMFGESIETHMMTNENVATSPVSIIETDTTFKENIDPAINTQLNQKCHKITVVPLRINIQSSKLNIQKCRKVKVSMSNAEKKAYSILTTIKKKLAKYRSKVREHAASLRAAKNIATNPALLNAIEKFSTTAKALTLLQFREHKKKGKGRRFNLDEKIIALSIFKQSPKCYRFLRKIFILPTPRTLGKLISQANVTPGINDKIFNQLKNITEKMKVEEKLCMVLFDEMALKANLKYNERLDKVIGFVTDGDDIKAEFADHVQVFMVRGLVKNYKKPVSYSFSAAATKGPELAKQLKQVIEKLHDAGLIVIGTVCDQGNNNRQAIKLLLQEARGIFLRAGKEPKENVIIINNEEIVPLYDPPHLLKCVRNNLITKNLEYAINGDIKTAKWEHIELLYKENPAYKCIRLIPKLTDNHVVPSKIPKMKVKYASQLFSSNVASNMGYFADKGIIPRECEATAYILLFFDGLFDSVNGSHTKKKQHGKPLLGPVTPTSAHHKMWNDSRKTLKTMKFINKTTKKSEHVPTISNWVWTLDCIEVLLKNIYNKYGVTSIWMRHMNQDPLENFFGSIRSHGCRNNNPTPEQFQSSFITLLINNMSSIHTPGANCEEDFCKALQTFIITDDCKATTTCYLDTFPEVTITNIEEKNDPRIKGPLDYVSGYFARCMKKNIFKTCNECSTNIIAQEENENIKFREYARKRWLCSPSQSLIICVSAVQDISDSILKKYLNKENIKELLRTIILIHVDFEFLKCALHKDRLIDYLINLSCRFFIHTYTKNINKILDGKRDCDNDEDMFNCQAKKHFYKCRKRKLK